MAALSKKVENCSAASTAQAGKSFRPGNPSSNSLKMTPMYPPSPVIEHLTADEIQALKDVFSRMERFEQEETERISKLERDVMTFEEEVEQQTAIKGQMLKQTDIRLCRLCFKNKFADGIGRVCVCCHRRVCNSCGSLSKWQTSKGNPIKHVKARWRCNLCHMRRELAAASGVWFHGGLANPVISSTSFRQKLHDDSAQMEMVNKFGTFAHHRRHPQTILSDSEVNLGSRSALAGTKDQAEDDEDDQKIGNEDLQHLHYLQQQQQRRYSSSNLRRLFPSAAVVAAATSAAEENLLLDSIRFEEEEDEQENEEKFLQERAKCRLERLLMQQKKTRKKAPRRASVGTCTMEDMIVTTDEVYDRVTEFLGFTPDDEDSSIGQRSSEERPTPATSHRSSDEPHLPTGSNSPGNALPSCPGGGGGSPATTPSKLNDRRKTESKGRRMSDLSDYVRNGGLCVSRSPPAPPNFPKLSMSRSGSETSSLSSAGGGREAVLKMLEEPDSNRKHDRSTEPTNEQKHSKSFRKLDDGGTSSPQKHHHKIYVLRHIKSSANIKTTGSASPNKDEILEEILLNKRHSASSSSSKRHATDCVERHAVPTSRRQSHPTWLESTVFNASSGTHSAQSSPARDATPHGGTGGTSGGGAVAQIPTITGDPCSDEEFEEMILRLHKSRKLSDAIYGLDRQRKCSGASHSSAERRKSSNTSLSDWRKMSNSSVLSSGSFASSYRDYQRKFSNSSNISSTASPIRRPSPGSRTAAIANPAPVQPNPDINLTRMQRKFSEPNAGYRRKSSEPDFKMASNSSDRRLSRSSETQRRMSNTVGSNHGHRKLSMSDRVGSIDSGAIISQRLLSKSDVLPKFNKSERTRKLSESAVLALIREKSSSKDDSEHSSSAHETTRRSSSGHHFTVVLQKDQTDSGCRTNGFGMRVVGGKQGPDKKLGAYVTHVIKGGPADLLGIMEGDQVLEWDGRSLQDSTFEEAREIISNSGDTVQLVLMHSRSNIGGVSGNATAQPSKHDIPKSRRPSTISEKDLKVKEIKQRLLTALIEQEKSNELAKLEGDDANLLRPIQGRLGLQLKYDSCSMTLAVSVLNCEDLPLRTGLMAERSGPLPKAYVKLNILPRSSGRHSSRTKAAPDTCNPEWNHVFTLEEISAEKLSSFSLLLTVWDDGGLDSDVFLGELLLDLSSVDVQGMTIAYPLQEHDQNCGRMPTPSPKYLLVKSTHKSTDDDEAAAQAFASAANVSSSTRSLPSTPGTHGVVRDFLSRKDRDTSPSSKSTGLAANGHRKSRSSKLKDFKRRVTEMAMKVKTDFQDKWETSSVPDKDEDRQRRGVFWSKRKRKTSLASSLGGSSGGSANTSKNHSQERILLDNPQTIGIENLSSTFLLGPGQIQPKHDQDQIDRGDIKLGLMISKGQLDIDVICARGLQMTASGQPPDTYVKTSLIEDSGKKRIQKKRTKIVKSSTDPLYVNKLRYSACNAHGRFLQVMVKENTRSFDPSRCLGEVYIQMDNLDLTSYTTGWFKLFKESSIDFGSSESVVTKTL